MSGTGALDAADVERVFEVFAELVATHAGLLDRLNAFPVPDADTGRNLSATMRAALGALGEAPGPASPAPAAGGASPAGGAVALQVDVPSLAELCSQLADGVFLGARGNSGTILAQLLAGFFEVVARGERLDADGLAAALAHAAEVGPLAVAEVADGTMLTVADAVGRAARAVVEEAPPTPGVVEVLDAAWAVGQQALARTIEENPVLAAAGVVDAGAAGYLLLLDAFLHVVDGRPLPIPDAEDPGLDLAAGGSDRRRSRRGPAGNARPRSRRPGVRGDVPPGVDVVADGHRLAGRGRAGLPRAREEVIVALAAVGDSVVVTGRPGCWTCHVHTEDIGAALDAALDLGRPRRVRVEPLPPDG